MLPVHRVSLPSRSLAFQIGTLPLFIDFQLSCMGQGLGFPEIPELAHTSETWRVLAAKNWRRMKHLMPQVRGWCLDRPLTFTMGRSTQPSSLDLL